MKNNTLFCLVILFVVLTVPCTLSSCDGGGGGGSGPGNKPKVEIANEDDGWTDEDWTRISVLDYFKELRAIPSSRTVMVGHNDEPNLRPAKDTDNFNIWTGRYPAMYSGDFLYQDPDVTPEGRWTMIREARRQWEMGNIIHLMFHVITVKFNSETDVGLGSTWDTDRLNVPAVGTGQSIASLTAAEWQDLLTEGGMLNTRWKKRLEVYFPYFEYLFDYGITVMFRPFHEMNQRFFWWGSDQAGAQSRTAALYRMTRDIFDSKGYTNIVWVWNMQDLSVSSENSAYNLWSAYDPNIGRAPGNTKDYWDVFCVDIYSTGGYPTWMYNASTRVAGDKPIGIGEVYTMPTPSQLSNQPNWVFAMPWPKVPGFLTTPEQMKTLYEAQNAVVHGMAPGNDPNTGARRGFKRNNTINKVRNPGFIAVHDGTDGTQNTGFPRAWTVEYTGTEGLFKVEHGRLVGSSPTSYDFTMSQIVQNVTPGKHEFSVFVKKRNTTTLGSQSLKMNVYAFDDSGVPYIIATRNISGVVTNLQTYVARTTDVYLSNDQWVFLDVDIPEGRDSIRIEVAATGIRNYLAISGPSFITKKNWQP